MTTYPRTQYEMFQSAPPARGATPRPAQRPRARTVSIRAPRTGGDRRNTRPPTRSGSFNPRPPHGGRHERQQQPGVSGACFNPRPPHGGRQPRRTSDARPNWRFQSAPPARGATPRRPRRADADDRFNPRPPHGGRPAVLALFQSSHGGRIPVSIRAPRTGGDLQHRCFNPRPPPGGDARPARSDHVHGFNPRPPHGGRRARCSRTSATRRQVSIRAPRTGGDRIIVTDCRTTLIRATCANPTA